MAYRPISTKCWQNFLRAKGFKYDHTSSSHDQWKKPGHRTIPVWGNEKQIPALHLKTSCKTIGCSMDDLYKWVEENC